MKTILLSIAAAGLFLAGTAQADQFIDAIVSNLQSQGYGYIEVKQGPTQVKVEAVRGDTKIEVVYDRSTGSIVKQETGSAGADSGRSGVEVSRRDGTFVDSSRDGGHDDGDDDHQGRGRGSDDGGGDDRGDHSGGDDHGDHSGGDDHGDHGGDDDHGGGSDDGAGHD